MNMLKLFSFANLVSVRLLVGFAAVFVTPLSEAQTLETSHIKNIKASDPTSPQTLTTDDGTLQDQFHWEPIPPLPRFPFAVEPDGTLKSRPSPDCDPRVWEQYMVRDHDGSASSIKEFYSRCEKQLGVFSQSRIIGMLNFQRINNHFDRKPSIRKIDIEVAGGEHISGLLGLHDKKPRPFVIYICGTGCNSTDSNNQYGMMHLFEESPFNVLAINNVTGVESLLANHRITIGGLEEAHRVVELMTALSKPSSPVFGLVTSWNIIGASLGAHAAYYASVIVSQNPDLPIGAPLDSVIAYCPVIDLEPTIRLLDKKPLFGHQFRNLMKYLGGTLLNEMHERSPISQSDLNNLTKGNLADTLARVSLPRLSELALDPNFLKAPFAGRQINTAADFWDLNNGLKYVSDIRVPTFLVYAKDDPIVAPQVNSEAVLKILKESPNSNLHVIAQKHGAHCANVESYGWPVISSLWRTIISSKERSENKFRFVRRPLNFPISQARQVADQVASGHPIDAYEWQMKNINEIYLTLHLFHGERSAGIGKCINTPRFRAFEGCYDRIRISFDPEVLLGPDYDSDTAAIKQDLSALDRWMNTRAILTDSTGRSALRSKSIPTTIQWYSDAP